MGMSESNNAELEARVQELLKRSNTTNKSLTELKPVVDVIASLTITFRNRLKTVPDMPYKELEMLEGTFLNAFIDNLFVTMNTQAGKKNG